MQDLTHSARGQTQTLSSESRVLTTGPPRNSGDSYFNDCLKFLKSELFLKAFKPVREGKESK